jgi:HEAT repeat protein
MNGAIQTTVDDMIAAANDPNHADDATFLNGLDSSNPSTVWWAIRGCGLKRLEGAIPKLLEILGKPCVSLGETDARRIAALSLSQMGFDNIKDYVIDIHKSQNPLLREGVADALGLTKDPRAVNILDGLMHDEDRSVLLWTSLSLAKLGNISVPYIRRHLCDTKDLVKVFYLLDALKKIGTEESKSVLNEYLKATPFEEVREHRNRFV